MKHTKETSDWDVLVVAESGHIWMVRTLTTLLLHLFGKRRHGDKTKNRVCLNYFITTESLLITQRDLFAAHEYTFAFPIFGAKVFERFQFANHWIGYYKPNYNIAEISHLRCVFHTKFSSGFQKGCEYIFGNIKIERWLGQWQKEKITKNPKTHLSGSIIVATNNALIFLPRPHGPKIFEKYKKRLQRVL